MQTINQAASLLVEDEDDDPLSLEPLLDALELPSELLDELLDELDPPLDALALLEDPPLDP
jgi:hypothetical protein